MPRKILVAQRNKFWQLYRSGHSIKEAARRAGFSQSYGNGLVREGRKDNSTPGSRPERFDEQPGPTPLTELSDIARDCLEDFGRFRARYLGSVSIPWQEQCAQRVRGLYESDSDEYAVVNVPQGGGKALALDTPMLTTLGWSTMGDLRVGDYVYGADGHPCQVTYKSPVFTDHDCYRVTSDDGASVVADADHLWAVTTVGEADAGPRVMTTVEMAQPRFAKPQLDRAAPLKTDEIELPIDPYVLGVWLGDGASAGASLTCHPNDQVHIRRFIEDAGCSTTDWTHPNQFGITARIPWRKDGSSVVARLRALDVLHNKHIPIAYLMASRDQRLSLLQGLIDTDGYVDPKGQIEFCSTNIALAKGVQFLARSLGAKASLLTHRAAFHDKDCGLRHRVNFRLADAARLPRKAERCKPGRRRRYLSVEPVPSVPTQCITVDSPDSLYLAGEGLLVTHNTRFFSHDLPAWLTVRDRALRGILGSLGMSMSTSLTANLRDTFSRTVPMQPRRIMMERGLARAADAALVDDYGTLKPTADETNLWRRDRFTVAQHGGIATADKEPTWAAFSYEAKFLGWRVDIMIWDDLVNTRMLRNPDQVEALYRWWDDEAESRLDPGGLCLLVGQRLRSNDIYRYALDKAALTDEIDAYGPDDEAPRQYTHVVYKAHYPELCEEAHDTDAAPYLEGGCLLDPRRVTWQKCKAKMNAGNFEVVYQQQDTDPSGVLVPKIWVDGGTHEGVTYPGCWDAERPIGQIPRIPPNSFVIRYVTVDPSPTKWWGIIDWLYVLPPNTEPLAGLRYLINIERSKMGANEFLDWSRDQNDFVGLAEDWVAAAAKSGFPIRYLIFEKNAAQRWAQQYDHFTQWTRSRGVLSIAHETMANKADPEFGINQTIPSVYLHGRVRLPGDPMSGSRLKVWPLVAEVTTYPDGPTNDCVMSQWMGEYNLQHLVHLRNPVGTIYNDRPSWVRQMEAAGAIR